MPQVAPDPRVVCIIEARFASTRLPGKVLMPIFGEPMLARMIERLSRSRTVDSIVVATSTSRADDAVAEVARDAGAECFRGSEDDVLGRVVGAARAYDAQVIAETTGDCPLHDAAILDKVVSDYLLGGADFVGNIHPYTTPRGTDVRVFSADDLAEIERTSSDPADREHVSLYFWEHPEKYRLRNVTTDLPTAAASLRLTVDTQADMNLVCAIYEELYPQNPEFTLADVLSLLERRPELAEINSQVQQKPVRH